jgi:hypothetical protein
MFHSNTELLIDYWRGRRGERTVPARADIDPSGFPRLAPAAFIAVREDGDVRFRFAGEAVLEWCGRALAGESLTGQWRRDHRGRLMALLAASLVGGEPLVVTATALTDDATPVRLEVLFAPLAGPQGLADRFLGFYQPVSRVRLGRLGELAIAAVNGAPLAQTSHPSLRLAALDGRRIA